MIICYLDVVVIMRYGGKLLKLYKGWQVALAGMGINFLSGISYAWSIFAGELTRRHGWTQAQSALPYTIFILCYAASMVVAGGIQDRIGPRPTIFAGGVLIGAAFMISSFFMTPIGVALIWGFFFGSGLACCFASVTPAAIKWFPPQRRGLVAGVVLTGVGLSALVLSPLVHLLVDKGVPLAFFITGAVLFVGILWLSRYVSNPPATAEDCHTIEKSAGRFALLQTRQFYIMWFMFCLTAASGLTFATHLVRIARVQASFEQGYLMVSLFALFNAIGRLLAGYLSDVIGRTRAMTLNFCIMAVVLLFTVNANTAVTLAFAVSLLAIAYGGIYTLFPAAVSAFFGNENFGFNYGLVFTAIGVAGIFPLVAGYLFDQHGNFTLAFLILSLFCALAAGLSFFLKTIHCEEANDVASINLDQ